MNTRGNPARPGGGVCAGAKVANIGSGWRPESAHVSKVELWTSKSRVGGEALGTGGQAQPPQLRVGSGCGTEGCHPRARGHRADRHGDSRQCGANGDAGRSRCINFATRDRKGTDVVLQASQGMAGHGRVMKSEGIQAWVHPPAPVTAATASARPPLPLPLRRRSCRQPRAPPPVTG